MAGLGIIITHVMKLIVVVLYRLFFHPLRHYPGPLTAKLFDLYGAFYAFKTILHVKTLGDHSRYDIYQNDKVTKSRVYLVSQASSGASGLFNTIDPVLHNGKRRLVGRALAQKSVQAFEPVVIRLIDVFIDQIAQHHQNGGSTINLTRRTKYLSIDIMGQFLFGYPLNLQTETSHRVLSYSRANFFLNVGMQLPFLGNMRISALQFIWSAISRKPYLETLEKVIAACLSQGQHVKRDLRFMSSTSTMPENDDEWIRDVRSEATWHVLAGSDTTSTTLSALFFYLSRNRRCYKRLCEEIRSAFSHDSEIRSGTQLASCVYLRACLDETMRMAPAIPGTLWREQIAGPETRANPLVVDGHVIPKGVLVGVNTYSLLHNEDYFPDPFTFKPERWLADADPGQAHREAFAPFSMGARGCLGKSMAYMQLNLVIAKTLWHFDFEAGPDTPPNMATKSGAKAQWGSWGDDEFPVYDTFSAAHDGPYLSFHPVGIHRNGPEKV
ncbi:cytochrome P450 [Xylariaceae sp. FL0804]|nr:cytochrome P450 [Xylariaceae sp. FL0804]